MKPRASPPLATDSVSSLDLPPVRMGLLTKLNLLTIGLIFVTAIATTGFYLWQEWRDEDSELDQRGRGDARDAGGARRVRALDEQPRARRGDPRHSLRRRRRRLRASSLDAKREPVAARRIADSLGTAGSAALAADARLPAPGTIVTSRPDVRRPALRRADRAGRRHPHGGRHGRSAKPQATARERSAAAVRDAAPIGYVRVGMTFERQQQQFRKHVVGALSVVALLIVAGDRRDAPAHARGSSRRCTG